MRMPLRSDSSFSAEISFSTFDSTSSAIFWMTPSSPPFLTM